MDFEEFEEGVHENIEYILSQSNIKLSAIALENFDNALQAAGLSDAKIIEIEKQISSVLFFYHYKDLIKERKK